MYHRNGYDHRDEVIDVRLRVAILTILILGFTVSPVQGQEAFETIELPGRGAGTIAVHPVDGSIWAFMHQTGALVAVDPSDGSVLLESPLNLRPTAMEFSPDGEYVYIVGEPLSDQVYDRGKLVGINTADGSTVIDMELDGACNAVHIGDSAVYVACGMQYAYEGTVYRLTPDEIDNNLLIDASASCGKIPWAIAELDGILYVTDLELQWTMQADGSMGPPYGSYVWAYHADNLELIDKTWVGLNPCKLGVLGSGVMAACSGSKQTDLRLEPALSYIRSPGESEPVFIDTSGASDLDVSPDGTWAAVTLADWGPPAAFSGMSVIQHYAPGTLDDVRRWIFTGDIGVISMENGSIITERYRISDESYFRAVEISLDGTSVYALLGETDEVMIIPVEYLVGLPVDGREQQAE